MIADSPYQVGEPVMKPWQGLYVGFAASLCMLLLVFIFGLFSSQSLAEMLKNIGGVLISSERAASSQLLAGFILHSLTGMLLGLLYALSQNQAPLRGLIASGVFYGFLTWIFGSVLIGSLFGETLRAAMRSPSWFFACLAYGFFLAVVSAWMIRRQPAGKTVTVLD